MDIDPQVCSPSAFQELLEQRLLDLFGKIGRSSPEELASELSELTKWIDTYKHNSEMLEGLLDPRTADADRQRLLSQLRASHVRVVEGREELERLLIRSQLIAVRSVHLFLIAIRRLHSIASKNSEYSPEVCGYCEGLAHSGGSMCPGCQGKRVVLVHQPPVKCPRCKGNGKPHMHDKGESSSDFCVICRGSGWALLAQ